MSVVTRTLGRPGDLGWVVQAHGELYAAEYGWDATFEALVLEIVAEFAAKRDRDGVEAWIAEVDGERAGTIFCMPEDGGEAKLRILQPAGASIRPAAKRVAVRRGPAPAVPALLDVAPLTIALLWRLHVDDRRGEGRVPAEDSDAEERADETPAGPQLCVEDHQHTDEQAARHVDGPRRPGKAVRTVRPRDGDAVPGERARRAAGRHRRDHGPWVGTCPPGPGLKIGVGVH